ncbi:MAG: Hsp20 family protein [Bacilli bacterium]
MLPSKIFLDSIFDDMKFQDKMDCDIYEKDNNYFIEVDVPGFDKNDITVECNKGNLTIIATKEEKEVESEKKYLRKERKMYGKFTRSFYLGDINEEDIDASFKDGILKITVPKKAEEDTKKIVNIK